MLLYFAMAIIGLIILEMITRMAKFALIVAIIVMIWVANPTCFASMATWLR